MEDCATAIRDGHPKLSMNQTLSGGGPSASRYGQDWCFHPWKTITSEGIDKSNPWVHPLFLGPHRSQIISLTLYCKASNEYCR